MPFGGAEGKRKRQLVVAARSRKGEVNLRPVLQCSGCRGFKPGERRGARRETAKWEGTSGLVPARMPGLQREPARAAKLGGAAR